MATGQNPIRSAVTLVLLMGLSVFQPDLNAFPREIVIQGTIVCPEQGKNALQRPARYVIVVPEGFPKNAAVCNEVGYYEITLPSRRTVDRPLALFLVGKSGVCGQVGARIAREAIVNGRMKCVTGVTEQACESFETDYLSALDRLDTLRNRRWSGSHFWKPESEPARAGIAGVLMTIVSLPLTAGPLAEMPPDSSVVDTIPLPGMATTPKTITSGEFLSLLFRDYSQNTGFGFTPLRNIDEAVFWNPAALTMAIGNQISLQTDYQDVARASASVQLSDKWGVATGVFWLQQQENRRTTLDSEVVRGEFQTEEGLYQLALYAQLSSRISLALSPKLITQRIESPLSIIRTVEYRGDQRMEPKYSYLVKSDKSRNWDVDLSATAQLADNLVLGGAVSNIRGSRIVGSGEVRRSLRSVGAGLSYLRQRLNLGLETRVVQSGPTDFSAGGSCAIVGSLVARLGFSLKGRVYTFGLGTGNLSYAYVGRQDRSHRHLFSARLRF